MGLTAASMVVAKTVSELVAVAKTVSELVAVAHTVSELVAVERTVSVLAVERTALAPAATLRSLAVAGAQPDVLRPCTQHALRHAPVECTRHSDPGKLVGRTLSGTRWRSDLQPSFHVERIRFSRLPRTRSKTSHMGCT